MTLSTRGLTIPVGVRVLIAAKIMLDQQFLDDVALSKGERAADIGHNRFLVIDPEAVEDGAMQVLNGFQVFRLLAFAFGIGGPDHAAALDSAASQSGAETVGPVIAAIERVLFWSATKFTAADNQG